MGFNGNVISANFYQGYFNSPEGRLFAERISTPQRNPDIFQKTIEKSDDFIILGSDGIFDVLGTNDILNLSWSIINKSLNKGTISIHQLSKDCVEAIILEAMKKKSSDNITAIFIALPGLIDYCNEFWNPKENTNKFKVLIIFLI